MAIVPPFTVQVLFEVGLYFTTLLVVRFFGAGELLPADRVIVWRAELLTTLPQRSIPASTTTLTDLKYIAVLTASKDVITGIIFQTPPLTPGTLFRIVRHLNIEKQDSLDT